MSLESLPTGFSNFLAFYCCRSDNLLPSASQSVNDTSTGICEIVCTFQCHSKSYGTVPLTTAFLYVADLKKISNSSCNRGNFMYFVICKIDHIHQNTSRYYPCIPELCLNCSVLCMKPCDMNCQPCHLTVLDLSFTFCLTVPMPHIVHPL
jgi:hypothetical protein